MLRNLGGWGERGKRIGDGWMGRNAPRIQPCEKMYIREQRRLLLVSRFVGEFSHRRVEEAPGCAAEFCSAVSVSSTGRLRGRR